jgi:hypothetical protein
MSADSRSSQPSAEGTSTATMAANTKTAASALASTSTPESA